MKLVLLSSTSLLLLALGSPAQEPPMRVGNPVVALAKTTEESIAAQEKELSDELAEMVAVIDAAISQVNGQDWQSEKTAIESFRPLVGKLRLAAKELVAKEAAYAAGVDELAAVLASAPKTYQQAAEVFRGYAAAETFPDIREDYLQLAKSWERLAQSMEARQNELAPEKAEVKEFLSYVRATAKFLERFDEHLAAYPRVETLAARDDYLKKMKVYVEYFGKLRQLLQKLNGRLGTPLEASPPVTAKVATSRSATTATPIATAMTTSSMPPVTPEVATSPPPTMVATSPPEAVSWLSHVGATSLTHREVPEPRVLEKDRVPLLDEPSLLDEVERFAKSSVQPTTPSELSASISLMNIGTETWGVVKDKGQSLLSGQVRGVYRHGRWLGEVEVRNSFVDSYALRPLGGIRLQSGDRIASR